MTRSGCGGSRCLKGKRCVSWRQALGIHRLVLMADGTVACWGHHDPVQIGLALTSNPGTLVANSR